jgi:hypothetical protein
MDHPDTTTDRSEVVLDHDDEQASGLVGGRVGPWRVVERKRRQNQRGWLYRVVHHRSKEERHLRGYQLVRLAREANASGLLVLFARPWRDDA